VIYYCSLSYLHSAATHLKVLLYLLPPCLVSLWFHIPFLPPLYVEAHHNVIAIFLNFLVFMLLNFHSWAWTFWFLVYSCFSYHLYCIEHLSSTWLPQCFHIFQLHHIIISLLLYPFFMNTLFYIHNLLYSYSTFPSVLFRCISQYTSFLFWVALSCFSSKHCYRLTEFVLPIVLSATLSMLPVRKFQVLLIFQFCWVYIDGLAIRFNILLA
jgi:hypothetical protein